MELQHQIYLLVAIFGGICALLLVLIIILGIFVRNVRNSIKDEDVQPQRSLNYGFEHDTTSRNIPNDDLRSMKSEAIRRPPHKSNLTKPRNDDSNRHQSTVRPTKETKRTQKGPDRNENPPRKQRQYSESGDTSGRYSDSAFDNEINNMFDIDDYDDDDDRDSVVSTDRNYNNRGHRNHSQGRPNHGVPPPPPSQSNNRNKNKNNPPPGMNRGGPPGGGGAGGPRSMYPAGNSHEAKTYFNERGMNY